MKALSIRQPYAQLIAEGIKPIENRSFKTNFRGTFYIHASAQWHDRLKTDNLFTKQQWLDLVNKSSQKTNNIYRYIEKDVATMKLHVGAIIGQVDLVDCVINHESIWAEETDFSQEDPTSIWNWVLANPILYEKPILNVKGKLSFWEFEPK